MIAALTSAAEVLAQADPDLNADRAMDRAEDLRQTAARRHNDLMVREPHRFEAAVSDPTKPTVKPGRYFRNFAMDLGWSYNTNPSGANGDASWRFNPKAQLNGGLQTGRVLLYGSLTADAERYPQNSRHHGQSITPYVSVELNNPKFYPDPDPKKPHEGKWKANAVVPYLFYSGTYAAPSTTSDFATRTTDLGAAVRARAGVDDWSLGMDVSAARRYSSAGLNSHAVHLKSSLTHVLDAQWSVSFSPGLRLRAFDADAAGNRRRDVTLATPITVGYKRDKNRWWDFSLTLAPTRNFSTSAAKENRQTDIGVLAHYVYSFHPK
jgi:hypothetical protein